MIPAENIFPGQYVAVIGFTRESDDCEFGSTGRKHALHGQPLKILSVSLPFLSAQMPGGETIILDSRDLKLHRVKRGFVKSVADGYQLAKKLRDMEEAKMRAVRQPGVAPVAMNQQEPQTVPAEDKTCPICFSPTFRSRIMVGVGNGQAFPAEVDFCAKCQRPV